MDLERLDEVIERAKTMSWGPIGRTLIELVKDYRDLANGERVEWCDEHGSFVRPERPSGNPGLRECESVSLRRLRENRSTFIMCRIVSKLLVDHPTEEE